LGVLVIRRLLLQKLMGKRLQSPHLELAVLLWQVGLVSLLVPLLVTLGPALLLPQLLGNRHKHKDRQTSGLLNNGEKILQEFNATFVVKLVKPLQFLLDLLVWPVKQLLSRWPPVLPPRALSAQVEHKAPLCLSVSNNKGSMLKNVRPVNL
jgi:hypothetical protein